jgi:hypothetical protein
MSSLHIGQERVLLVSRSSSAPERESWSREFELPEWTRRGLRLGDLLCVGVEGESPPNTRRARDLFGSVIIKRSLLSPCPLEP